MRCPSCAAESPVGAAVCSGCGAKLTRQARRRANGRRSRLLVQPVPDNAPAMASYRCALYGLVPVAGLALGACAVGLGIIGYRRGLAKPESNGCGHAVVGIILGGLELLTNGIGLFLIGSGLRTFQ